MINFNAVCILVLKTYTGIQEGEKVPSLDIQTGSVFDFPPSISLLPCREQWDIVAQSAEQVTFFGECDESCTFFPLYPTRSSSTDESFGMT